MEGCIISSSCTICLAHGPVFVNSVTVVEAHVHWHALLP